MTEQEVYNTIIAVFTQPEKKKMMVMLAAVFVAIIICGIAVALLMEPPDQGSVLPPASQETPSVQPTVPRAGHRTVTQSMQDAEKKPVDFILIPEAQIHCGMTCRALTATIKNTGTETAHNICITLVVLNSRDETIFLNGAPSISQCVGDIAGGASKSEPITINADCGVFMSRCVGQTLRLQIQATSDEKTVRFPDQMIPV